MRLFWISIIIVEMVFAYIVWRPYRDRAKKSSHRAAVIPRAMPREIKAPELKPFVAAVGPAKPSAGTRPHATQHKASFVVNASLKAPEPLPAKPNLVPRTVSAPADSFWCHLSTIETTCDCKAKDDQHTANLVVP